jgi:hypothetical protein
MTALGKRYRCEVCGSSFICLTPTESEVTCCSQELVKQAPQELPSSD